MAVISRSQKERLSYKELDERSDAIARGLRDRGVGKGERVAVSLGNSWEFAVVTYSLFKLGAILVCVIYSGGLVEIYLRKRENRRKREGGNTLG
jgi:non-ribosomal peptide synthetase component E (peptide arylation enzyme)